MNKTLYLECNSGISGDMTVGTLLDLGADEAVLNEALESLLVDGFHVEISRVKKAGLDACDFNVILDNNDNHDYDMEYLHGHSEHNQEKNYIENHHDEHHHDEHHSGGSHHTHLHRGLTEIIKIIDSSKLTEQAKQLAKKIFTILGESESKAHGVSIENVHFHEVGAVDSIVDIVSVAVCLDNLGITDCVVPVLYEGSGSVRCQHGILPVPVPAVANIISQHGIKLSIMQVQGEFVTPTGAAIVAAIKTTDKLPESFTISKVGIGAGKRQYEKPSILRGMIIEETRHCFDDVKCSENTILSSAATCKGDTIWKLESNIDDSTGEEMGFCMEQLFKSGARDVHYFPVYMKKNRPAYQINVICMEEDITKLEDIIFKETTTIGIRRQQMERTVLDRRIIKVKTDAGDAFVKICQHNGITRYYPEYNSVSEISKKTGMSFREVYNMVVRECGKLD